MAEPLPRGTALLIGSWKYDPDRKIRNSGGKSGTSRARVENGRTRVDKKTNIKRVFTKDNKRVPDHAWVSGDLDNMESLIEKNINIELFYRLDYREKDDDGVWAQGKKDVLKKIEEFFQQDDKIYFVLYFSGHGDKDGSWCFAISTRADVGESRSSSNTRRNVDVPPHNAGAATAADPHENTELSVTRIREEYEILGSDRPDPVKEWIELVKYEDVIDLWERNKMGRQRYLMIILDCCHSGRWVQMVNGENIPEDGVTLQPQTEGAGAEDETQNAPENVDSARKTTSDESSTQENRAAGVRYTGRNDVCIQAACRPTETCMVADNQHSSVFTRAFVAAQNRSDLEKMIYAFFDHAFLLNVVSMKGRQFTPMSSQYAPFSGIRFFDSFDDMYLKTH